MGPARPPKARAVGGNRKEAEKKPPPLSSLPTYLVCKYKSK